MPTIKVTITLTVVPSSPEEELFSRRVEAYFHSFLLPIQLALEEALRKKLEGGELEKLRG